MKYPVGVKVSDAVQDLPDDRLDHHVGEALLVIVLARAVEFEDLLEGKKGEK